MKYDTKLWNKYTEDNEQAKQKELSKFLYFITLSLGAKKVCEAGCNVGNNISAFPKDFEVYGIDINEYALKKAQKQYPNFKFTKENLDQISYPDSFFDLVFTRGVLVHIPDKELDKVLLEFLRITKRWIINIEYFGKDGKMIKWKRGNNLLWYRNMKDRWKNFDVEIISDVDLPLEMDKGGTRFTLAKKNES